jgi:hypothetical protein
MLCHICLAADDGREGETGMAKKSDTAEFTFLIAIDENGKVRGDEDSQGARERLNDDSEGDCLAVYEVTVRVPKARRRKVDLGTITVAEDGASLTVESVEAV